MTTTTDSGNEEVVKLHSLSLSEFSDGSQLGKMAPLNSIGALFTHSLTPPSKSLGHILGARSAAPRLLHSSSPLTLGNTNSFPENEGTVVAAVARSHPKLETRVGRGKLPQVPIAVTYGGLHPASHHL